MSKPAKPSKNLIVTEGKNDVYVFHHLLAYHKIEEGIIDFNSYDGVTILLEVLPEQLRASGLERLGIVVDADTDLNARWDSLKFILAKAGYLNLPANPLPEGTIIYQEYLPIVGVWIMPDNKLPGMLEDFVSFLVPQGDPLWEQAKDCLNEIPEPQRKFKQHFAKAHIHTWLAWQEEPGTPLGSAINKRYLDADAIDAQKLMGWVRRLFDLKKQDEQVANEPIS